MVLPAPYKSVPLHFTQLVGQHRPFHIEIVCKLLTVNDSTGLDISFYVGEGILDFCYTDFTKEQDGILLFGHIFSQGRKREDIVHNREEVYEVEQDHMERTLTTLGEYLYQSV